MAAREMTVAAWRDRDPGDAAPWSVYLHVGV
jgi:hypothetical protein